MVDVEECKARDDEHDEEGDNLESNFTLLLRRQHTVDFFLTWKIHLLRSRRLGGSGLHSRLRMDDRDRNGCSCGGRGNEGHGVVGDVLLGGLGDE